MYGIQKSGTGGRRGYLNDANGDAKGRRRLFRAIHGASTENTKSYVKNGINDGSFITWIAEEDGKVAAMGAACFFMLTPNDWCPGGKTAYICNVYIRPELRGRGTAGRLVGLIVDEAKGCGCERIWLHTEDAVKPLYEKHGFAALDTAMGLYPFGIIPKL